MLGPRFDELPAMVRHLHDVTAPARWTGTCAVERGQGPIARIAGALAGLPSQTDGPRPGFTFAVTPGAGGETWSRGFDGSRRFHSIQWERDGLLYERAALMTFAFAVQTSNEGLSYRLERCWLAGLPVPRRLYPVIEARESESGGKFGFDVAARLPWGGLLVHYKGSLAPAEPAALKP